MNQFKYENEAAPTQQPRPYAAAMHPSMPLRGGAADGPQQALGRPAGRRFARRNRGRRPLALALAAAVPIALALAATGLWSRWLAPPWGEQVGRTEPGCDPRQRACRVDFGHGRALQVQARPESAAPTAPLQLEVRALGFEPRQVSVDLDGATMNMGPNPTRLVPQADGRWSGRTALSACISGRMTWVMTVRAAAGGGTQVGRLRFESGD